MPKKHGKKRKVTRKQRLASADRRSEETGGNATSPRIDVEYLDAPVKSECDNNDYRAIKLSNGLRVVLVTDSSVSVQEKDYSLTKNPKDDKAYRLNRKNLMCTMPGQASCTMTLDVGSFSDPLEVPCVSQILSSIVLKASQKYTQPNGFLKYVTRNGGQLVTSSKHCERTSFYFDVSEGHFRETIERFVQCFVGPLLRMDDVEKERKNIEYEEWRKNQIARIAGIELHGKQYILDSIASTIAGHPGSNLGPRYMKNLYDQTNERIFAEVKKFMNRHYSAHRMTVVIEGRLPLDTMENYAKTYFSKIPNNELPRSDYARFSFEQCFDKPEFRMMYQMSSYCNIVFEGEYKLELNWPMPSGEKLYRSKPQHYIGWIMNYKGKGSLIRYLKAKGWCTSLDCGIDRSRLEGNSVYSLFNVALLLTRKGHEERKQVLDAVFSYINLMRREGPQERIYEEIRKIEEAKFRFDAAFAFSRSVMPLHDVMLVSTSTDYLTAGILYFEYSPTLINQCLDLLSPEKANIIVFDCHFSVRDVEFEDWEEEDNDPVRYRKTAIPKDWIDHWKTINPLPEFNLPELNAFIDDDYALVIAPENSLEYPTMIHSDDISRIWYKLDVKFLTHENFVDYRFRSPLLAVSPENDFMMDLFAKLLVALSFTERYAASVAGIAYSIESREGGLLVTVTGHSKKILLFAKEIVRYAANLKILVNEDIFKAAKSKLLDEYWSNLIRPQQLMREVRLSIVRSVYWSSYDKYTAAETVDFVKFQDFAKRFPEHIRVDCLAQGNLTKVEVIENVRDCVEIFGCKAPLPDTIPHLRIREIPRGSRCCRFKTISPILDDTVVINYYQFGDQSLRQSVIIKLFCSFLLNAQFARLRARERLDDDEDVLLCMDYYDTCGYSLCQIKYEELGIAKVSVMEENIDKFRKAVNKVFKGLSEREWKEMKEVFTEIMEQPDSCLEREWARNWGEISSETFVFDRQARELKIFKKFTIEDLREGLMNLTSVGPGLRKLTVQAVGNVETTRRLNTRKSHTSETSNSRNNRTAPVQLELLTNLPREKEHPLDYFVRDLEAYRRELTTLPLLDVTGMSDITEAIRRDCNV